MRLSLLGAALVLATLWSSSTAQVKINQPDLKLQTVWDNIWGVVQVVFLADGKVMTVHKTGELHAYASIRSKAQDYVTLLDIKDEVYSWWDHGLVSATFHPQFPQQPYLYIAYSSEYPGNSWGDQCVPDPKKVGMTNPPDTRPYCKTMAKLVRLKVDPDLTTALVEQELFRDWCTSSYTHHVGTMNWLGDGSMVYGAGDGSHFQGLDHGMPQDECTDPKGPKDQGVFTSQKDGYLRGKFLRIAPASLLKNEYLKEGVDFQQIGKGARNPFRATVDPKNGDVYFGDVGSSVWEEINRIPNPLAVGFQKPNFGWPCVEGIDAVSDIYQTWLRAEGLLSTCQDVYDGKFNKPVFSYRYGAVDPDFPDECADADASVSGITFYTGNKLPAKYQGKMFWVDYSKKCGFWFDQAADGTPDFSHAHAFMTTTGAQAGGVTDVKTGLDGYLYVVDYAGGKLYRFGDVNDGGMDGLLTGGQTEEVGGETAMWIESTPATYNWQYGDVVTYKLMNPPGSPAALDPKQIKWRVTNGHCVKNPCTGTNDCHMHEVSLSTDSLTGFQGSFRPSPHPMESFVKILATVGMPDGSTQKVEFTTHALTYNYKLTSDPPGLPIIIEEFVCLASPCITSQMAKTNPGFAAQNVQVYQDEVYKFDHWSATSVTTNKKKKVSRTIYEETADGDYTVQARYQKTKMAGLDDPILSVPQNVLAEGDFKRVSLKWDPPIPGPIAPDFIIISIKDGATGVLVKDHMTTAAKGNVVLPLPTLAAAYTVDMSFLSSAKNTRGIRSLPVPFQSRAELTKGKAACLAGTQFAETLHASTRAGLGDLYQIGVLGTYPTTLTQGQKVRLTFGVVSETATQLMVNVLNKNGFTWVAGKIVNVPAKTDKMMNVEFTVVNMVKNKEEYFIDALLVQDAKDYTTAFVEDTSAGKIFGVAKPDPLAIAAPPAFPLATGAGAAAPMAPPATVGGGGAAPPLGPPPAGPGPAAPMQQQQQPRPVAAAPPAGGPPMLGPGPGAPQQPAAVVAAANP